MKKPKSLKLKRAIQHIKREIRNAKRSLKELDGYKDEDPVLVAKDRRMWTALIPELELALLVLEETIDGQDEALEERRESVGVAGRSRPA